MIYKLFHRVPFRKCDIFGVGEIVGGGLQAGASVYGAERAKDATDATNETNYKIAQEANELQDKWFHENQEFNAIQAQMNRDFQSAEAEKARVSNQEWNSIGAQAKRAIDYGFNPAVVTGGASGTTVVGASPQGSAASSGSTPNAIAAQMQNPANSIVQALAPLAQIGSAVADIGLKKSQQKKTEADTKQTLTYNQFQSELLKRDIKVSEAQESKIYADIKQSQQYIDVMKSDIERIKSITSLTNNESVIKAIEAKWKDEELQSMIKKNLSEAGWNDQQINYYKQLLPVQLGLYRSQSALNSANAALSDAQKGLTNEQVEQVRAVASLIQTQGKQALLDYSVNRTFQMKNAKEGYYQNKARTDQMEYAADDVVQILGTTSEVLSSVAGAAASVTAAGAASKYIMSGAKKAIPETGIKAGNWKPRQQLYY